MYAVIFKAEIKQFDNQYNDMAKSMRQLAQQKYGCTNFIAVTEGKQEIAISYWQSLDDIQKWKQDAKHLVAQKLGKTMWYQNYQVEIVEILRSYKSN